MPLIKSSSKKVVGKNIKKEIQAGKPKKQAIAIALNTQRKAQGKKSSSKFNNNKYESTRKKVFNLPKDY